MTKVLLIDDDEEDFYLIKKKIAQQIQDDWEVHYCQTAQEGLNHLLEDRYDLYLLDENLDGGQKGSRILKKAVESGFHGGVVLLTGDANLQTEMAALDLGAIDFIDKNPQELGTLGRKLQYAHSSFTREKKMAALVREKNILIKEVNHRIKENINNIIGLIQIGRTDQGMDAEQTKGIIAQLQLMSTIHSQLMQGTNKSRVSLKDYLGSLIDNIIRLFAEQPNTSIQYTLGINDWTNWDHASQLSTLIYEIINLSIKHCHENLPSKHRVEIKLYRQQQSTFLLISDNGSAYHPLEDDLDQIILQSLCRNLQLESTYSYAKGNQWLFSFQNPGLLIREEDLGS
jgi:two-component sensor histidine kinase